MSKKKRAEIRKIQIISLIDTLKKIYDNGADFIDIHGEASKGDDDVIRISVRPEYYTDPDAGNNKIYNTDPDLTVTDEDFTDFFPPIDDEDINDLIK